MAGKCTGSLHLYCIQVPCQAEAVNYFNNLQRRLPEDYSLAGSKSAAVRGMVQCGDLVCPHCLLAGGIVHASRLGGAFHCLLTGGIVQCAGAGLRVSSCLMWRPAASSANATGVKARRADSRLAAMMLFCCDFFMVFVINKYRCANQL